MRALLKSDMLRARVTDASPGEEGSGTVCLNGAAAKFVQAGNPALFHSYYGLDE